jgi:hypothetical protein
MPPANDLAHPHATVIRGYQVDTVFLKDGAIVRPGIEGGYNGEDPCRKENGHWNENGNRVVGRLL